MRANWKECPRGDISVVAAGIHVSMSREGHIMMGKVTWQRMQEPKAFVLLFDEVNNRIGLKPAQLSTRNAYPVAPRGRSGGRVVYARRLLREFGIDLPQTVEFPEAEINDEGHLILDLRTVRISLRSLSRIKAHERMRHIKKET
jgi:hypothetical protein